MEHFSKAVRLMIGGLAVAVGLAGAVSAQGAPEVAGKIDWGVWVDDDGCMHWWADGGLEGYMLDRVNPKTGKLIDSLQATNVGDLRSSVCYDEETEAYYFTSKGGDLYQVKVNADGTFTKGSLRRLHLDNGADSASAPPMSTSTP